MPGRQALGPCFEAVEFGVGRAARVHGAQPVGHDHGRAAGGEHVTLKVQAGAVANIEGTRTAVNDLVTASQSATGALQAAQAGNQLLAVQSQQLADLIASVTSLGRAQTLDAANSAAAKAQAREQLRRFLAPGRGYVPTTAQMFRN